MLDWYRAVGRPLAFRRTTDPWAILVSEVMAQQTQARRAAEAWERFTTDYPTPAALAAAPTADVLRAWRGLGYNRRAILLQRAARAIVAEHDGRVPADLEALRRLPGIGPYTARAVAALAFGRRVGAVDTNVRRVLARAVLGVADPSAADPGTVQQAADELAPAGAPGLWTHALMDVGATICRPRRPRCPDCPLRPWCRSAEAFERPSDAPLGDAALGAAALGGPQRARRVPGSEAHPASPFQATSRWLRGRILDRLRDQPAAQWLAFDEPIGSHDLDAVLAALRAMAVEGLVELREATATGLGSPQPARTAAPEARLPAG